MEDRSSEFSGFGLSAATSPEHERSASPRGLYPWPEGAGRSTITPGIDPRTLRSIVTGLLGAASLSVVFTAVSFACGQVELGVSYSEWTAFLTSIAGAIRPLYVRRMREETAATLELLDG